MPTREHFRLLLKCLALAGLFVLAPGGWLGPIVDTFKTMLAGDRPGTTILYLTAVLLAYGAIVSSPFLNDRRIRLPIVAIGIIGFTIDQMCLRVADHPMTIALAQTLWDDRNDWSGAAATYKDDLIRAGLPCAALAVALLARPPQRYSLGTAFAIIPVLAFASSLLLIYRTREVVVDVLPSPIVVPAQFVMAATAGVRYRGARQDVSYDGPFSSSFEKIVYVVDESVRADYLGLNNAQFDNTPFLNSIAGKIANYGVAISGTNCSRGARFILRSGLRESQIPDFAESGLRQPSMWQYAQKAGFRTIHIDGFGRGSGLHSFMNAAETKAIDHRLVPDEKDLPHIDSEIAAKLRELLAEAGAQFIFVEKYGVHAPYDSHLAAGDRYKPAGIATLPQSWTARERSVVDTYLRATRWRVDQFFAALSDLLFLPKVLWIYTSDHGQSMFDGGYAATHCTGKNPVPGEAFVPLVVFTGETAFAGKFLAEAKRARDRATHFEIFPTLLSAFGYEAEWVKNKFGPDLLAIPVARKRRFSSTQPLKSKAQWVGVD